MNPGGKQWSGEKAAAEPLLLIFGKSKREPSLAARSIKLQGTKLHIPACLVSPLSLGLLSLSSHVPLTVNPFRLLCRLLEVILLSFLPLLLCLATRSYFSCLCVFFSLPSSRIHCIVLPIAHYSPSLPLCPPPSYAPIFSFY